MSLSSGSNSPLHHPVRRETGESMSLSTGGWGDVVFKKSLSFPPITAVVQRLAAILFLVVLVFSFYGYKLVIACMQNNESIAIEQKLDKQQYNDSELISIKTTLHLPYYTSSSIFERVYGSITIDGKAYDYVKKRVYHDTLEVLCLPNHSKTKLQEVSNELTRLSTDQQAGVPTKKSTTIKISLPDFFQTSLSAVIVLSTSLQTNYHPLKALHLFSGYIYQPERPPQSMPMNFC